MYIAMRISLYEVLNSSLEICMSYLISCHKVRQGSETLGKGYSVSLRLLIMHVITLRIGWYVNTLTLWFLYNKDVV